MTKRVYPAWLLFAISLCLSMPAIAQIGSWTSSYSINWLTAGIGGAAVSSGQTGTNTTGLGPGWTDVTGNVGAVVSGFAILTSDGSTQPYYRNFMLRPVGEVTQNQRIRWIVPPFGGTITSNSAPIWWSGLRYQSATKDYYLIGLNGSSGYHSIQVYQVKTGSSVTSLNSTSIGTYDQTKYYVIDENVTTSGQVNTINVSCTPYTGDPTTTGTAGTTVSTGAITDTIPGSGTFSDMTNAGQTLIVPSSNSGEGGYELFTAYSDSGQISGLSTGAITANATTATSIKPQLATITGGTPPYSVQFSYSTTTNGSYTNIGSAVTGVTSGGTAVAPSAQSGLTASTAYYFRAFVQDSAGTPLTLTVPSTSTGTALTTNASTSISVTQTYLPSNHGAGTVVINVVGNGITFTTGTGGTGTQFSVTGPAGWSFSNANKTFVDATHYTLTLSCPAAASPPAGATGNVVVTDTTDSLSASSVPVNTPSLAISPTSGLVSTTPTLTLTGTNTLWATETATGLFTVSGGTGASLATPTSITNTGASDVLTVGTGAGTLTVTDASSGATATFTASNSSLAITYPLAQPTSTTTSISPTWSWSGGASTYTITIYRSTAANFTPGSGNQVAQVTGISGTSYTYTDTSSLVAGTTYYYKATVTDSASGSASVAFHVVGTLVANSYVLGLLGDSITAGANIDTTVANSSNVITSVGSANSPSRNLGWTLASTLQASNAFRSITFVSSNVATSGQSNQAISGKTSVDWWNGGSGLITTAISNWNAMSPKPNLFCIMLGTNDVRTDKRGSIAIPGAIGTAGSYADNMQKIVNSLLTNYPGCLVFIHYPTYCTPNGTSTSNGSSIIFDEGAVYLLQTSIRSAIQTVVASFATSNPNQVYVGDTGAGWNYFAERYNTSGAPELCQEQYTGGQTFFLHPNATGAADLGRIWATSIYNALFSPAKGTKRKVQ